MYSGMFFDESLTSVFYQNYIKGRSEEESGKKRLKEGIANSQAGLGNRLLTEKGEESRAKRSSSSNIRVSVGRRMGQMLYANWLKRAAAERKSVAIRLQGRRRGRGGKDETFNGQRQI